MNIYAKKGDAVTYTGSSEAQRNFCGYALHEDYEKLQIGKTYQIDHTEVHSYNTEVYLEGFNRSFNSVCFEDA